MPGNIDIEHHLLVVSERTENETLANASFSLLYETFREFVHKAALSCIFSPLHKNEMAQSVVSRVFLHIYNKPLAWSFDSKKHSNQENGYKAYLSVVTKNCAREEIRNSLTKWENEILSADGSDDIFQEPLTEQELEVMDEAISQNHQVLQEVLLSLKEKEREIILMYYTYFEEGKKLPSEIIAEMASTFKTNPVNIRKIVSRTKEKIKSLAQSRI